ncbi:MAG: phosphoribosylformylglycinamidine synthase subunit PurL [Bdellovibrionota bacterium]
MAIKIESHETLLQKFKKYRINQKEYDMMCGLLKREPQGVEWALFSALWSEHCSYKSSKVHLRKFFNKNHRVLVSEGENSGVIDLGEGEKISFKMESHNHPSFIEPYQGAATGVGGILRDIFTMGARPVMTANYLCFGDKEASRMKSLVEGVVGGISGYGNCVGVPAVTGFTEFHPSYNKNILVNAFALGVLYPGEELALSKAHGVGNLVVYVGAKTGRDGIHGASMASESFDDKSAQNRPTVQIGDPFFEKLLIESCLEVIREDLVVAIQDMGAAGLTSSSFEMSSKGQVGLKMELDKVPLRDSTLTPEDILLSESQERMLLVCEPKKLKRIQEIFHRWGLDATTIGEVLPGKNIQLFWQNEKICEIDPDLLVENAPKYERPYNLRVAGSKGRKNRGSSNFEVFDVKETLEEILSSEYGTSRNWIFSQYDQRVGSQTAMDCSNSIGVTRLEHSKRGLGLSLGCRPYLMRLDSHVGAADSVLYPALNLAVKGFEPLALTDCLNFASPENPEIMTEFVTSVETISAVCKELNAPVISGNVSFYNETLGSPITSTPATGMVGMRASVENIPSDYFGEKQTVYLVYNHQLETGGKIEEMFKNKIYAQDKDIDIKDTASWILDLLDIANDSNVKMSKTLGKFGLAYALSRASTEFGVVCDKLPNFIKTKEDLFRERMYEVLFAVENGPKFEDALRSKNLQFAKLGVSAKDKLVIESYLNTQLANLNEKYKNSWENLF